MLQTSIGKQLYTEFQKVLWHLPAEQPPTASQHLTTWQGGGELWIPGANFAPTLLPPSATSSPIAKWLWTKEDLPSDTTWSFSTLEGLTFHSDLEGWKVGGGSIPPEIVVTSQRPDLVILDKRKTQTQTHHPLRVANFVANCLLIPFLYKELGITSYI